MIELFLIDSRKDGIDICYTMYKDKGTMESIEDQIRAILYPDQVVEEEEKEILPLAEATKVEIEQIKQSIKTNIEMEDYILTEKKIMHEEFEERYSPVLTGSVILNSLVIFIFLIAAWYIVVIAFGGTSWAWLWCPFLTILMIYQHNISLLWVVPPDRAVKKAVLISVTASLCFVSIYELIKYLLKLLNN